MKILKGLFKFFYPLILFYTSAIASFGIVYCAFRVFTPNVFESLAFEILGYILIAALTYPILMFLIFLGEKLKNAINNYSTMAKLSDFALTVFLTILIATIIICPSAVLFGSDSPLQHNQEDKDLSQVIAKIDTVNEQSSTRIEYNYILNTNSNIFHYPDCPSVDKMKEKNKVYFIGSRNEVILNGYKPCANCDP